MPYTTPATVSNHLALRASADNACEMAQSFFKKWLALRHRVALLQLCKRHAGYANLPLEITAKALAHCRCKPIRECLATVVKVQRGIKKYEKDMENWNEKEIALNQSYRAMAIELDIERLIRQTA